MFICDMCGECCRNLNLSDVYSDLDSGDGTCKYLDGNFCSIYNERPLKCRIEDSYYAFFSDSMTKEEYYNKNIEVCNWLKKHNTSTQS